MKYEINPVFKAVIDMFYAVLKTTEIKTNRNFLDFMVDKLRQASTTGTLLGMLTKLCELGDVSFSSLTTFYKKEFQAFILINSSPEAVAILKWINENPGVTILLANAKTDDSYLELLENISLEHLKNLANNINDKAKKSPPCNIDVTVECLSPLAHGHDTKAGNATLFRRMDVLGEKHHSLLKLPFYSGNAFRGLLRDILAEHFLSALNLGRRRDKPAINLWFFYALYSGGALSDNNKQTKKLQKKMGNNGLFDSEGIYTLRSTIPCLSLLGAALTNRIIEGRISVCDLRPCCFQWNNINKKRKIDVQDLFSWEFLVRQEKYENHKKHSGMIAVTECLKPGTMLKGGIDWYNNITDIEKGALGLGLKLLSQKGKIGAENRRGFGQVNILYNEKILEPFVKAYIRHLKENKKMILDYLISIDAITEESCIQ